MVGSEIKISAKIIFYFNMHSLGFEILLVEAHEKISERVIMIKKILSEK